MNRAPLGFVLPQDALNAIGRWRYGADWTGEEHKAPAFQCEPGELLMTGSGAGTRGPIVRPTERPRAPDTPEYRLQFEANRAARERWTWAVGEALRKLEAGEITAVELRPSGRLNRLPAFKWRVLDQRALTKNRSLFVAEFQLPAAAVVSRSAAEAACQKWLTGAMRTGPAGTDIPKADWHKSALAKFDGLSRRAFERAWAGAIQNTGASGWANPGAKSKRQIPAPN